MTTRIGILRADWQRLRLVFPDGDDIDLLRRVLERGRSVVALPIEHRVPDGLPAGERTARLRGILAREALATDRFALIRGRERFERAGENERRSYERHLELERDLVPPQKLRAGALRAEVRRLEAELRASGKDPSAVHPAIDWAHTLAVDDYSPPRYENAEDRRRTTVAFFRRRDEVNG